MTDSYLTLEQATEVLPLSLNTLYRAARRGEIGAKLAGRWMVRRSELDEWYERSRPRPRGSDPMPPARPRRSSFRQKLAALEGKARA